VVLKDEAVADPWGAYEGVVKPDLDAGSRVRGGKSKTVQPDPWATIRRADQTESVTQPVTLD
jgi:hypothetical protein